MSVGAPPGAGEGEAAGGSAISTTPPDVTIPVPPAGFVPVNFANYRGCFARMEEFTAIPDAVTELEEATSYESTFGGAVSEATKVATDLDTASKWTKQRIALEAYLLFVRSFEAVTWKAALADMEQLRAAFKVVAAHNPTLLVAFPATQRLLEVQTVIAQRAAATRAREAKARVANASGSAAAAVPVATAVPVANAGVAVTNGGGTGGGAALRGWRE